MTVFEHQDMKTRPTKAPKLPKMITRKIKFQPRNCADDGWLIVNADRIAHLQGGYVIKCKISNWEYSTSYIKFRCPKDRWSRLVIDFLDVTNRYIKNVECGRL